MWLIRFGLLLSFYCFALILRCERYEIRFFLLAKTEHTKNANWKIAVIVWWFFFEPNRTLFTFVCVSNKFTQNRSLSSCWAWVFAFHQLTWMVMRWNKPQTQRLPTFNFSISLVPSTLFLLTRPMTGTGQLANDPQILIQLAKFNKIAARCAPWNQLFQSHWYDRLKSVANDVIALHTEWKEIR